MCCSLSLDNAIHSKDIVGKVEHLRTLKRLLCMYVVTRILRFDAMIAPYEAKTAHMGSQSCSYGHSCPADAATICHKTSNESQTATVPAMSQQFTKANQKVSQDRSIELKLAMCNYREAQYMA